MVRISEVGHGSVVDARSVTDAFSRFGTVDKVVVFPRSQNFSAFVQMDSVNSAEDALRALDGKDMFDRSCLMRIEFSSKPEIRVNRASDMAIDYTMPSGSTTGMGMQGGRDDDRFAGPSEGGPGPRAPRQDQGRDGGRPFVPATTPVAMVHEIPELIDMTMLFHLLGCFGNVVMIRKFRKKPSTMFVQFQTPIMVDVVRKELDGLHIFGSTLAIVPSRKRFLDPYNPQRDAPDDVMEFTEEHGYRYHAGDFGPGRAAQLSPTIAVDAPGLDKDALTELVARAAEENPSNVVASPESETEFEFTFASPSVAMRVIVRLHLSQPEGATKTLYVQFV